MSTALDHALKPGAYAMVADMLKPPDGMTLRRGVLTSFTLDLATALIVPLIVAGHDADDPAATTPCIAGLPFAMERLAVFLEAGQLSGRDSGDEVGALIAPMLREMLVPDRTPNALHTFHPKLFALQFKPSQDRPGVGVRRDLVRLVIGSRNLSRSNSRDLAVVMEGEVGTGDAKTLERNEPIASLLRALPAMRVDLSTGKDQKGGLPDEEIEALAAAVERTALLAPDGFKLDGFALGMPKRDGWRPERCERFTVVSPFCHDDTLAAYVKTSGANDRVLVSRRETLDELKPATLNEWDAYNFGGAAQNPAGTDDIDAAEEDTMGAEPAGDEMDEIDRLHAKLFVEERAGAPARLTVGSGNATDPARKGRNVEIYAVLRTNANLPEPLPEAFAAGSATAALDPFVIRHVPGENVEELPKNEQDEGNLGRQFRLIAYELLDGCYGLRFERASEGWACRIECFAAPKLPGSVRVEARPVTALPDATARLDALEKGGGHDFSIVPLTDLTPFVEFTMVDRDGGAESFVTQLPHTGFPTREHRAGVLRRRLPAPEDWLSALAASLGRGQFWGRRPAPHVGIAGAIGAEMDRVAFARAIARIPLLESMVDALEDREALEAFGRTLEELRAVAESVDSANGAADSDVLRTLYAELATFWTPFQALIEDLPDNTVLEDA